MHCQSFRKRSEVLQAGYPAEIKVWSETVPAGQQSPKVETSHYSRSRYSASEPDERHVAASERVRLWVEDCGIGISREAKGKLFGIFERGDRANEFEGTGIGLAIVARAMERMGGQCGVESELGSGSRFWLEFRAVSPAVA